jgi:predicted short-subunit dehydrogenase-like oxidoreductase (DUF2520 family)
MGAGLGMALAAAGNEVVHLVRTNRPAPSGTGLFAGEDAWGAPIGRATVVLVATPDAAITPAAATLAALGSVTSRHVVLHLSGLHDRAALAPLEPTGAGLGSLHPLQAVSDPATAATRLRGAFAGIEGDSRAVRMAEELARSAGLRPVTLPAAAKPGYHAAAAIVSNFTVALFDVACRVAERAGVPRDAIPAMYAELLRGTVENLAASGSARALTGAIRRGDAATVRAHLAALGDAEASLYRVLGREVLRLAREGGLDAAAAERIAAALEEGVA